MKPVRRALSLPALAAVAWLPASAAFGAPTVRIGTLEVPAGCALARKEHPRLLLTRADLPALRERIQKPGLKEIYGRLKETVDDQLAKGSGRALSALVPLGLLYQVTGDRKYGEACRAATLKAEFGVYATLGAYGYDLCYDLLAPDERRACEEKMLAFVRQPYRESARFIQAAALWGSGLEDDLVAAKLAELHRWCVERKRHLDGWAADRGGDDNSHGYIGQHEYVGTMGAFQAWRAATGEDWFDGFLWARTMAPYYLYHILPGARHTVNVGINSWGENAYPEETGAENFTAIAQSQWKCGVTAWWIRNVILDGRHDYRILGSSWGPVLWYDPAVPEVPPDRLPEDRLFRTRGYLCMRSGWRPDDTFVHFHCGRFESDGRNQPDNNAFVIYRKAHLACDSGTRGLNNPEQTQYSDGRHHELYFKQTIAHNTITVGTGTVEGMEGSRAVCGGQVSRVPAEWLRRYGLPDGPENRITRQAGTVVAYETSPAFCYAAGDARCSYAPDLVRSFTRQVLYVRPGAIVVFDRVEAARPEDPKRWYLHTMEQPACLDGGLRPDPSVHPEGHFLAAGRTLRAAHGGSALFVKTLLPEQAVVRVLGGPGHRFEVNGEDCDMNALWWQKVGTPEYQERIGLGAWRVEVEPAARQAEDLFLHVLWAADDSVREMVPVEKTEAGGRVGVRFTADGVTVEAEFDRAGPPGGRVRLSRGGQVLADRPLAARVEDDYRKWEADPRHREWMTNDALRSAIGEAEVDAWRKAHGAGRP
jgi:hypothetical protein